jgi:hypothetical protein
MSRISSLTCLSILMCIVVQVAHAHRPPAYLFTTEQIGLKTVKSLEFAAHNVTSPVCRSDFTTQGPRSRAMYDAFIWKSTIC